MRRASVARAAQRELTDGKEMWQGINGRAALQRSFVVVVVATAVVVVVLVLHATAL